MSKRLFFLIGTIIIVLCGAFAIKFTILWVQIIGIILVLIGSCGVVFNTTKLIQRK